MDPIFTKNEGQLRDKQLRPVPTTGPPVAAAARNSIVGQQQRPSPSGDVANKISAIVIEHINDAGMFRSRQRAEQNPRLWPAMLQRRSKPLTPAATQQIPGASVVLAHEEPNVVQAGHRNHRQSTRETAAEGPPPPSPVSQQRVPQSTPKRKAALPNGKTA